MTVSLSDREKIDELEEQVRYLMEMLAPSDSPYENPDSECPLPPVLASILHLLMQHPIVPTKLVVQAVQVKGRVREEVELSTVRVHMSRLRNIFKPYGIAVGSKQGSGYFIREADKEKVRLLYCASECDR